MANIKLSKLPDRTPVKFPISLSPELKRALDDYRLLYWKTYRDEDASVADLIPAMLEAFLASDRTFAKAQKEGVITSLRAAEGQSDDGGR